MNSTAADWVYDVVLTQRYKESAGCIQYTDVHQRNGKLRRDEGKGAAFLRSCPCFEGRCGQCAVGRPDRCAHRDGRVGPGRDPATNIFTRAGASRTAVWSSGRGCKWNCPGPDLRTAVQPELFALAGAS